MSAEHKKEGEGEGTEGEMVDSYGIEVDKVRQEIYGDIMDFAIEKHKQENRNYISLSFEPDCPVKDIMVFCIDNKPELGPPHWYYLGFGLCRSADNGVFVHEEKEEIDDDDFGVEFSFRLARTPGESTNPSDCPKWPLDIFQSLGNYIVMFDQLFGVGHHTAFPIALDNSGKLTSVVFAPDPVIPLHKKTVELKLEENKTEKETQEKEKLTEHIQVLQVVGITAADHAIIRKSTGKNFLEELARTNPLLVTNMALDPIASDEERVNRILSVVPDIDVHLTDPRMSISSTSNTITIRLSKEARNTLSGHLLSTLPKRKVHVINQSTPDESVSDKVTFQESPHGTSAHIEQQGKLVVVGLPFLEIAGLLSWCQGQSETFTLESSGKTCVFEHSKDPTLIPLIFPK